MSDLRVLFFIFIPQGLATFYIGLAILGLKISPRKIILYGILYGFVDYLGKNIFMQLGLDILGNIMPLVFQIIIYRYIFKIRYSVSIVGSLASLLLQFASVMASLPVISLVHIDLMGLVKSGEPWNLVYAGNLNALPLYLLCLFQVFKPFSMIDFSKKKGTFI